MSSQSTSRYANKAQAGTRLGTRPLFAPTRVSCPVRKTVTGCVRGGVFIADDGNAYKVRRSGGGPMSLKIYDNQRIRMIGNLLPGGVFYPTGAPQRLGCC